MSGKRPGRIFVQISFPEKSTDGRGRVNPHPVVRQSGSAACQRTMTGGRGKPEGAA